MMVRNSLSLGDRSAGLILLVYLLFPLYLATQTSFEHALGSLRSDSLKITSPREGAAFEPGQTIFVEVWVAPGVSFEGMTVALRGVRGGSGDAAGRSEPPYQFSLRIPSDFVGQAQVIAAAITGPGKGVTAEPVGVVVETSVVPESLEIDHPIMKLRFPGAQLPLRVTGKFKDRRDLVLNHSTKVRFESADENIATVSPTGMITATGQGSCFITIRYQGLKRVLPVIVPVTLDGDLDGDHDIDSEDLKVASPPLVGPQYRPATGPFDARDRNKDGVIDATDVELLRRLCTRKNCSSRRSDE